MDVRVGWQGRGIGSRLLDQALRARPADRNVVVGCLTSSSLTQAFYQKHGFKQFEERDFDFGAGALPSTGLFIAWSDLSTGDWSRRELTRAGLTGTTGRSERGAAW
jgi:predicted N-acetyltransferase YhbS